MSGATISGAPQDAAAASAVNDERSGVDRLLRRVRWIAAGLTILQFVLYSPPPGVQIPFSRWWGIRDRQGRPPTDAWFMAQLVWDCLVVAVVVGMFTFDDTSALWALLIIPVLEAATRGWRARALVTFGVLCGGYIVREIVVAQAYPYNDVTIDSVTYRLGVLGLVALSVAGLTGRLARQIAVTAQAEQLAEQLRGVAIAARRMSSLDLPTVIDEVTRAAEQLGFTSVSLISKDGAVPGTTPDQTSAQTGPRQKQN